MGMSDYMAKLREKVGNELLLFPGVCALVFNDQGQILLNRRSDTSRWAVLGGALDPGEEPAAAVVREVLEETGVQVIPERITGVYITPVITYPNGHKVQYAITAFACRPVAGRPRVNDDESLEVRYFALDDLPDLHPAHRQRIDHARTGGPTWFAKP